jgi:hypothetical protein
MGKKYATFLSLMFFSTRVHAADSVRYLGVLEKWDSPTQVRAAFKYENKAWSALPVSDENYDPTARAGEAYPKFLQWTIGFDGKVIGHFNTTRPDRWEEPASVGLYTGSTAESNRRPVPPSRRYAAVSPSAVIDPDHWKPWKPLRTDVAAVVAAFRKQVGPVSTTCSEPGTTAYTDALIQLEKAYRARNGDSLVELRIDPQALKCDGEADDNWSSQWFRVHQDTIQFIGAGLTLIDAGDYDQDGSSEVVFGKDSHPSEAYVLLFDHLRKSVEFSWSEH